MIDFDEDSWGEAWDMAVLCSIQPAPPTSDVSCAPPDRGDVVETVLSALGVPDGDDWVLVGRLRDGRWFSMRAGCDYTGWDCQASGSMDIGETLSDVLRFGLTGEERKRLNVEVTT